MTDTEFMLAALFAFYFLSLPLLSKTNPRAVSVLMVLNHHQVINASPDEKCLKLHDNIQGRGAAPKMKMAPT